MRGVTTRFESKEEASKRHVRINMLRPPFIFTLLSVSVLACAGPSAAPEERATRQASALTHTDGGVMGPTAPAPPADPRDVPIPSDEDSDGIPTGPTRQEEYCARNGGNMSDVPDIGCCITEANIAFCSSNCFEQRPDGGWQSAETCADYGIVF